ncbi:MAG TPA: iron chelate uptake ABC transporter family permease subunit, partial [Devosia sp.]|nr:iron chelate uptake ABC transporter family permease subunit [Devosia sp.]
MTAVLFMSDHTAPAGDRSALGQLTIIGLALLLLTTMILSMTTGASGASALNLIRSWFGLSIADPAALLRDQTVIYNIRLPRMILGMLVGAALAVSGLVMQGLFRNPLADPGLVGVSAGAGLGAVSIIVLGTTMLAPLTALLG